ncbi:MAG: DUF2244 domain-containing protein [Burkholderiales bacterium]|jgi:uncharacterized membrane protein|nr:DUF2244 domain-containing protein [Burkholderiales bacterium]
MSHSCPEDPRPDELVAGLPRSAGSAAGAPDGTAADRPVFSAILHPHRSLGVRGYRLVLLLVAGASMAASIPFVVMGFWPVAGFYGLDFALIWFALHTSRNEARSYEEVTVSPVELLLRKVPVRGQPSEYRFNPIWTRLHREEHEEFGVQGLALVSRGRSVPVGQFLTPDEKASFGDELGRALALARRGPDYSA